MTNTHLDDFVKAWITKAEGYDESDLSGAFDRFFSLFVPFNALYQESANRLIREGIVRAQDAGDQKSATDHVVAFIGANPLKEHLKSQCGAQIDEIVSLISSGTFYVNSKRATGEPDHEADIACIREIIADGSQGYCTSILKLIYKTRCNMFHGSKNFEHIQIDLIKPMNVVLNEIMKCLISKLHRDA